MSEQLQKQLSLLHSISRALGNFKKLGRNNWTPAKIRSRITALKETWTQCVQVHAHLQHIIPEANKPKMEYFEQDQLEVHEEIYQETLDYMNELLEELDPPNVSLDQSVACASMHAESSSFALRHLPPIQLPPFSGKIDEWESFRDRFDSLIIQNKQLSNFSRMHFLASSLTGHARDPIASLSVTADNFEIAWKALTSRYENKRRIIESHVSTLYNLPTLSRESAIELHALRDKSVRAIAALKHLGRSSEEILSDILVYFVSQKLDPVTRRAWKLKFGDDSPPPKYEDLTKFLSSRALALEELTPSKPARESKVSSSNVSTATALACPLCKKAHFINKCSQFVEKTPSQRRELVRKSKRCFNCLSGKHGVSTCPSKFTCRTCQGKHHTLLHVDSDLSPNVNTAPMKAETTSQQTETTQVSTLSASSNNIVPSPVLLATARVTVYSPTGRSHSVRALLDQGSEVSLITENLAQALRLRRIRTLTTITAVGGTKAGTCRHAAHIRITPRDRISPSFSTLAFVMPALTKYTPRKSHVDIPWEHLTQLCLADEDPTGSDPIDLLIGADLYSSVLLEGVRKGSVGQPIAQNTHLGWVISGPIATGGSLSNSVTALHCLLEQELHKFWVVEELPKRAIPSPEEEKCERHFLETHSRDQDGRYVVRLPFKENPPLRIGESRAKASRALSTLIQRLNRNSELKREYTEFLAEYEQLKHMERVSAPSTSSSSTQTVYIPHHAVIKDSSATTRLRVVFNASSETTNGTSLNSHLLAGPKLQTDIFVVILRWRQHRYVYIADIAKMFRQIKVDTRDRDYQRILWIKPDNSIQDLRMCTVTYGTAPAPFLALRVIEQLIHDEGIDFPLATAVLTDDIYVDDVLFGAEDIPLLRQTRDQVCDLLLRGGFRLRKWASNHADLLSDIPSDDHGLACTKTLQPAESLNVLGIVWNPALDVFQFQVSLSKTLPNTKRSILSTIAKLFDPLGWVTPVVIAAKIFMQVLWRLKVDWDDSIPPHAYGQWETIYRNLSLLNGIRVPRWTRQSSDTTRCAIHGFADASNAAYAAVVYLRVESLTGEVTTTLLAGKSKVAPIKPMSIPRLELSAMVLLSRLIDAIRSALNLREIDYHGWTDSRVALAWVSQHPSKWKTFVSHRVDAIQSRVPYVKWHHVPTEHNSADCASRGILDADFASHTLWWQGPPWLRCDPSEWPLDSSPDSTTPPEEAKSMNTHLSQKIEEWDLAFRYSSWHKLLRVTAYVMRFLARCRNNSLPQSSIPSQALFRAESERARLFWLKTIQAQLFSEELSILQRSKALPSRSSILSLNPFLDENGLIRVGGRLENAPLPFSRRHPIVLASHPLVKILIRDTHIRFLHAGVQLTLASLRREFWILRARDLVKSEIHRCVVCTRERAAVSTQLMGQLPTARVTAPARAFQHCGVDYAGPIAVRASHGRGITTRKSYIALFICLATRAVHLELVGGYSTSVFLDAYTRFCARRGLPEIMYSDNGTTFTGADRELMRAYREAIRDPDFLNRTAADKVSWKFIPPHAPHFGGLWEAGVRSVKYHLRRVIGTHTLTFEELSTLLCKVEACLNSRPLGPLSDTLDDYEPLTPGHFLVGTALTTPPRTLRPSPEGTATLEISACPTDP